VTVGHTALITPSGYYYSGSGTRTYTAYIMNAANEEAVASFLNREIGFLAIAETIEEVMINTTFISKPTIEDYKNSDHEARRIFKENLARKKFVISPEN
jgi:1-deoxy-D-xylulose 5-phosphate reductoisomerase